MADYTNPEVLVSTDWVQDNIAKPGIKIVESNEDILLYDIGHIEGAIKLDWETELQDNLVRDYINKENSGMINLIGIESPGLTCSLAIGEYIVEEFF